MYGYILFTCIIRSLILSFSIQYFILVTNPYFLREEEAIKLDGLNVSQMKQMRDGAEKHEYQAEVNRMMKLIINSLYKNKEVQNKLSATTPWRGPPLSLSLRKRSTLKGDNYIKVLF